MQKIVIVAGVAGGLELATSLGKKLGKKNNALITLLDKNRTHLWKPLLHEVAAGPLDRDAKKIKLAKLVDNNGIEIIAESELDYDILVMALNTKGVSDHCIFLDNPQKAKRFHHEIPTTW